MKKVLIFIFLLTFLTPKAQNNAKQEKLIIETWKYNVAYDSKALGRWAKP